MKLQLEQTLENIADSLVPLHFQESAPQFYDLVKSFLRNIEDVQQSSNINFLDTIDLNKIKNTEITDLYIDTYLNQFNFDEDIDKSAMVNVAKVSKSLSTKKGTIVLYNILFKLLIYLLPELSTQYTQKQEELKNATDEGTIKQLEEELEQLEINNLDVGYSEYYNYDLNGDEQEFNPNLSTNENIIPFKYSIKSTYSKEVFDKYVKPFAHPTGWEVKYSELLKTFVEDNLSIYLRFNMYIIRPLPYTGDEPYKIQLGTESDYETYAPKVVNKDNLIIEDGNLFYNYIPLKTCPAWLELDTDKIIENGGYLPITAGFPGLEPGLKNLVTGNTNFAFPLKVLPYMYIPDYLYMGENFLYKETDIQPNKPLYIGTVQKIQEDGTTIGSDYVKENQYNDVKIPVVSSGSLISNTNNWLISTSGDWLISDLTERALQSISGNWLGSIDENWLIGTLDNWGEGDTVPLDRFIIGTDAACVGGGLIAGGTTKAYSRTIVNDIKG